MPGRVLIVDDDATICELVVSALSRRGFQAMSRMSADEAMPLLQSEDFDVIVTDMHLEGMDGLDFCRRIVESRPDTPVVLITAYGSLEAAVSAIRAGAYDFITKPFEVEHLALTIHRAVQHRSLRAEVKRLRRAVADASGVGEMIGSSPAMKQVYDLIERVADTDATVLVTGESGTGKELVARALHQRSKRKDGPFVAINCAALPESLLESELFGHIKGAFTDATSSKSGLFLAASGGTLFLDEIADMPLGMQVKLLRSLQERMVRPVGGSTEVAFDVRLVAATNQDLESKVAEHLFREDLFYRINVVHIHVPPLRDRAGDTLTLAQHFLERFGVQHGKRVIGISSAAAERLLSYDWSGNVRELQNCIERAVALTRYDQIGVDDLPEKIREYSSSHVIVAASAPSEFLAMDEVERRYVLRVLQAVGGNKTLAAQVLGFDRKTLYRKLQRYGLANVERLTSSPPPASTPPPSASPSSPPPVASVTPERA